MTTHQHNETMQPKDGRMSRKGNIGAMVDKLAELYTKTHMDWSLYISWSLTEPTCPAASIEPDDIEASTRYSAWGDSVEEAVAKVAEHVHREVILGETIGHGAPWTNPSDSVWPLLLTAWKRGERPIPHQRKRDGGWIFVTERDSAFWVETFEGRPLALVRAKQFDSRETAHDGARAALRPSEDAA